MYAPDSNGAQARNAGGVEGRGRTTQKREVFGGEALGVLVELHQHAHVRAVACQTQVRDQADLHVLVLDGGLAGSRPSAVLKVSTTSGRAP